MDTNENNERGWKSNDEGKINWVSSDNTPPGPEDIAFKEFMKAAHKHSFKNEKEIMASDFCGCFSAYDYGNLFTPDEVGEWIDERDGNRTVVCPRCHMDTIIGTASGFPVMDKQFRADMAAYYFASNYTAITGSPYNYDDKLITLVKLPGFTGKLYRSVMPYGRLDVDGTVLEDYWKLGIHAVVLLADDEECKKKAIFDLRALYAQENMQVLYQPTPEFEVLDHDATARTVQEALALLKEGKNVVVHCSTAVDRTSQFLACLAGSAGGIQKGNVKTWLNQNIPGNFTLIIQRAFVEAFLDAAEDRGDGPRRRTG